MASERSTERVCEVVLELMTRTTGYSDDITVLAAQRVQPPAPLELRLPALADSLVDARHELHAWAAALDLRGTDTLALAHATGELLTNAVVHAYRGREPGDMTMCVGLGDDGHITVRVSDEGRWEDRSDDVESVGSSSSDAGRGLQMSAALLDSLSVAPSDDGTVATGSLRPSRPARLVTGPGVERPVAVSEEPYDVSEVDGVLLVRGPLLLDSSADLDRRIRRRNAGGQVPLTVDLAGTTHVGSSAVRVLHRLITDDDAGVTLVAPPGSVAHHVLTLVGLPLAERRP